MSKRLCDVVVAAVGLAVTWPVFLVVAALIKLDSSGPVFFRQQRIGKGGVPFRIFKFRTMVDNAYALGPKLTQKRDPRITRVGLLLRWLKLDELPQLLNVLVGEMSLVGPRPEDPHFVALYTPEQRAVLGVRPGLVGPSQIMGRDELDLYPEGVDTEQYYVQHILPPKLATDLDYVRRASLLHDLRLLVAGVTATVLGSIKLKYLRLNRQKITFMAVDTALSLVIYYLAFGLKFDWDLPVGAGPYLLLVSLVIVLARPVCFAYFGLYQNILKYLGTTEFVAVVKAVTLGSALITATLLVTGFGDHSRAVLAIDWMLLIVVLFGYRLFLKARSEASPATRAPALIVGADDVGEELARQLLRSPDLPYVPVGFLDDDLHKQGALIHGVRVLGTVRDLPHVARLKGARMVLISSSESANGTVRQAVEQCRRARIEYRILPALDHLLNGVTNGVLHDAAPAPVGPADAEAPEAPEGERRPPARHEPPAVLVTGGAGYVGSWLVRKLLDRDYRVRVLDSFLYGDQGLREIASHPRLQVIEGDIRHLSTVARAAKGVSGVIALAALVGDAACDLDPEETLATNFESVRLLADVCRRHEVPRLVFASSCSVYGANSELVLNEGSWLNPVSLYARTRIQSEEALLRYDDLGVVILRLATVFGLSPRMRFDLLVNTLTLHAVANRKMLVFGGSQWRPNLHVQDAAEAFLRAFEAPAEKVHRGIFNVGANENNHTILEVAERVKTHLPGVAIEIKAEQPDARDYRVAFDKIHQVMGFKPRFGVEDGIREIADVLASGKIRDPFGDVYHNYRHLKEQARRHQAPSVGRVAAAAAAS
jgi:lipopolysaccharide/colanic/teichoic acid biosynthesis glycosyltransferase/nucleoside-diphosphate-sugar epimerase